MAQKYLKNQSVTWHNTYLQLEQQKASNPPTKLAFWLDSDPLIQTEDELYNCEDCSVKPQVNHYKM